MFPTSSKKLASPLAVEAPVEVDDVVVDVEIMTLTVAVEDSGGVPPSVAVRVSVYVVPAATPERSTCYSRTTDKYTV